MKKLSAFIAVSFALGLAAAAWADQDQTEGHHGHHPCHPVMEACKKAGFVKGGHKDGKGLFKDCMHPLMEGKSVAGVTLDEKTIDACKKHKEEWKEHHHKGGDDEHGDKS